MKASSNLLIVIFGVTTALVKDHIYVNIPKNWTDAQSYCKLYYKDLSTIQSNEEQEILIKLAGNNLSHSWIGLYRDKNNSDIFLWSDGDTFSFSNWALNQPDNYEENQFCVTTKHTWYNFECNNSYPFFCQKIILLVKTMKTWKEALDYCRTHHRNLASLTSMTQLQLTKKETLESQTDSVWTGLRFMAGEWLWLNMKPRSIQFSLPDCPAEPYRCGAHNTKTDTWENRDCDEKLNFLCS
ncbi:macrophage mannose receptor 1-like [Xyrauchen texanus]|uniref:macrophage mannose receptor 1-like n=1 Tax=Xyrauchen texanus TaxID=154827 RepID=UPI0022425E58|nr:macrophage mannose receptor 1-like [Xyrauchen texanus]XP_051983544.1 macrophage mannose receptor 1-like [Xyrauchen texanus]